MKERKWKKKSVNRRLQVGTLALEIIDIEMATVGFQQPQKSSINFALSLDKSMDADDDLNQRIEEFKHQNPEDVEELKKCIQDVLGEAEKTAQERIDKKAVSCRVLTFMEICECF